ncbi:TolC family protein [soil metagenome]
MNLNLCRQCRLAVISLLLLQTSIATAQQDTLKITAAGSEKIFLQNNLSILAANYNIDANQALIRQAKSWDNPMISTDQNIYDRQDGFFQHGQTAGQVFVQVSELIRTAGKRNKLAQLATDNTSISVAQFDDLVRTLRNVLFGDLIEIDHQLKIKRVYDAEINELQKLVTGMDEQLRNGNISEKEDIRIKALLFSLQNELVNADTQLIILQSEVRFLLNKKDSSFILPVFHYYLPDLIGASLPSEPVLLKMADSSRPDLAIARTQLGYQKHNLVYQKALAKADITVGTEYDQHSSYAPDYVGLAVSFPLNIINRNKGNISAAGFAVKQQEALLDLQFSKVENDIFSAVKRVRFFQQVNNLEQLEFSRRYDIVFQNMLKSYQQRQISLLEFIDFADAYKDTRLKLLEQHTGLIKAIADLNYEAGRDVVILNN